jgi:hypothetical protein
LSIVTIMAPPCLSSNLPSYLGSALVKIMLISGCCGFRFVVRISRSGKNQANNGHSSYAEASQSRRRPAPETIFLEGASASESDFAWILSGFLIIWYLPKMMFLKDTCLTYV